MAEERLIDRDKNKKYRFRINENGEEELVIDDGLNPDDGDENEVGMDFEVPEYLEDDEDAAVMTPEQLALKRAQAEKEENERRERVISLIATAKEDKQKENYATALEALDEAEELDGGNGEIHALKLLIYTKDFSSYDNIAKAVEVANDVEEYATNEQKAELAAIGNEALNENISYLQDRVNALSKENEEKKAERAKFFNVGKKKWTSAFGICMGVFAFLVAVAVVFSTMMFSNTDGTFIVLTIVFGALAFIDVIPVLITARRMNTALRRVRLNKKDTSTELGRTLIATKKTLDQYKTIYSAINV